MQGLAQAKQAARDVFQGHSGSARENGRADQPLPGVGDGLGRHCDRSLSYDVDLVALALVAKVLLDDARVRALRNEEENRRNEQAILRLLDDMSDLAEGDLTKHAQVTEDMTGAIADSVNYAIDELRSLVTQINTAASQLTESSTQGPQSFGHLLQVAEKQSEQIEEATGSVLQMASAMDAVSENASKCADVAEQSLAASGKGGSAVQDSIASMNSLREHIQETSKRIKRLGGELAGDRRDRAADRSDYRTDQRSRSERRHSSCSGGRSGTGLYGRSGRSAETWPSAPGEATKQIGSIVKAIQNDTQDAVAAMEKSTHGVVRGAQLADSAGRALEEIREVSHRLAELVASISSSTLGQQQVAKQMAQRMQDMLDITMQSTKGTKWTAESMAQISRSRTTSRYRFRGSRCDDESMNAILAPSPAP